MPLSFVSSINLVAAMLLECNNCQARVDAEVLAEYKDLEFFATRTYLCKCPSCHRALVAESEEGEDMKWTQPLRVHPRPRRLLGTDIAPTIRHSVAEAERCMQVGAYLAATAMCGRALEAICRHFGTKNTYLAAGLKELRDKEIIDVRLYQWGEELRDQRNAAAHATDTVVSVRDAADLLVFTYAIIDYIFLLTAKFEQFQKRKRERVAENGTERNKSA